MGRAYTDEDIIFFSNEVLSISGLLKKLNLAPAGGNYANIKRNLQRLNVNTEHWTGQSWNKDKQLKDWSKYTKTDHLKKHLLATLGHRCYSCGLENWLNEKIALEVHHIDGDRTNNNLINLQLLCPNCHAQTKNWRGRNIKK